MSIEELSKLNIPMETPISEQDLAESLWLQSFVEKNSFLLPEDPAKRLESRCVDGRYQGNVPPLAMPGADAGDIMKAFAAVRRLGADPTAWRESMLEAVLKTVGGVKNFKFHTDEHAMHERFTESIGCGHLNAALKSPAEYGLEEAEMQTIFHKLAQWRARGAHQEVLRGEHLERAVVIVDSKTHGLLPRIEEGQTPQEVFVFHDTLHQERLDVLANNLFDQMKNVPFNRDELRKALDEAAASQLKTTLNKLAPQLKVFRAYIEKDKPIRLEREK